MNLDSKSLGTAVLGAVLILGPAVAAGKGEQGSPAAVQVAAVEHGGAATQVVAQLHSALLQAMKHAETLGYQGRHDQLAPVLRRTFDLAYMARKAVGRHWKKLTEEEQQNLVRLFTELTVANYAGRFEGYSGQDFETLAEEPAIHDTMVVHTRLIQPDDENIQLNYRLRKEEGGWKIIDVYLNGTVSELALRRSEYSAVIKREGFDALVAALSEKIDKLEASGEGSS